MSLYSATSLVHFCLFHSPIFPSVFLSARDGDSLRQGDKEDRDLAISFLQQKF